MTPVCQPATEVISATPARSLSVRAQIVLATCGCASAATFLYAVDPHQSTIYPQCWLYNTTGIYCAGCGATRALHALLHGRMLDALHDNVLLISALPLLAFIAVPYLWAAWQNKTWPQKEINPRRLVFWAICAVAVMLIFMALRNLPGWPFALLKPLAP